MPTPMPTSPHAWNPVAAAVFATAAIGLASSSGASCSFLTIAANLNETLAVTNSSNGTAQVVETSQGLFCESGYYDLDDDPMWILSRAFLSTAIVLMVLAALTGWAMCFTIVRPSLRLWRCIAALSALSSLLQVPVYLVFEIQPCSQHRSVQSCTLSAGSYLLVAALIVSITVTLITQCLDPPLIDAPSPCVKESKEQDADSTLDDSDAGGDGSLFSQLGACIRKATSPDDGDDIEVGRSNAVSQTKDTSTFQRNAKATEPSSASRVSRSRDVADLEHGFGYTLSADDTASRQQGGVTVGDESTQWESFASRFEIKPAKPSSPPRPTAAAAAPTPPAPRPALEAVVPVLAQAKADKSSIFRDVRPSVPFDETPPRAKPGSAAPKVFSDPPGILGQDLVVNIQHQRLSPIRPSLSSDGGKPPAMSRRGKVLRGYALLDEDDATPEKGFIMSPPLEIVTLKQMAQIENDDDSIDLGFGALVEDDDMADYFMSIQPQHASPMPSSVDDVPSELDLVFGSPFHESEVDPLDEMVERQKQLRVCDLETDDNRELPQQGTDEDRKREQELIVEEVLRRRGGRLKKQRRKKSSGCSVSASSQPSLLDVTIEEETAEDILREEQPIDPYNDTLLVRTRSAPNLAAYTHGGATTENWKSYECVHVNGINSYRLAETYWSDEHAEGSKPDAQPVTPDFSTPGSFDGNQEGMSFSSDPTERSRRARIARIQRLRRENEFLARSVGGSSGSADPPRRQSPPRTQKNRPPRIPIVSFENVSDLRLIEALRPNGVEYGPDEASL